MHKHNYKLTVKWKCNASEGTLNPIVTVTNVSMINKANELHKKANELCFISNSVNFPVLLKPTCKVNKYILK